ncbi:MAG: hypothetical protein K1W09_02440 [Akkermansia muciniphila]|uniref:hypothetical protein n=1 Tax=uncultured Akkermansia sp. TaxID=512294 RepID=UPI00260DF5D9|nr:hypothetical protein [uncultured Akkermansia sp.]
MPKTTIEKAADRLAKQNDREWKAKAPRFSVNGKEYVEEWFAHELFTRLKMILFLASNFSPGITPESIMKYREGLANIAKHGVPEPEKTSHS